MKLTLHRSADSRRGFTIIEILVSIVVISILVVVTVVSYNGATDRAERSAIVAHVKQYANAIEMYIADNGKAPAANWRCLGDSTTLPAKDGYDENYCFKPSNGGTNTGDSAPADPQLMQLLRGYMDEMPTATFPESQAMWGRIYRGMIYDGSTNNFPNHPATLTYFTRFPECPIGEKVNWWTNNYPDSSGCVYILSRNEVGTLYVR
ncbi:prepilin-type N-terminal cleavage/methylation domain-containing protein [Candidatus Nomurabacteria bacterium]|nr:prepilin-type N-terminal cleavage/methylation domain-containing protein [Candidatus Nomurabacteria bacterium]